MTRYYENGQADPSPLHLKHLAHLLEVTSDYLLGLSDLPNGYASAPTLTLAERQLLEALRNGQLRALVHLLDQTLPDDPAALNSLS